MKSYSEILTEVLVHQSSNELFYRGNIVEGAKLVDKYITSKKGSKVEEDESI